MFDFNCLLLLELRSGRKPDWINRGKVLFFTFMFGIFWQISLGQTGTYSKPNFIPPSPEASSMFKFIDIPVSKATGVPNISIPIYEIKLSDLSVPISIHYNSSGIRADEISGSIGLGWTLSAGGMISATVNGTNDMGGIGYLNAPVFPEDRELSPQSYLQPNFTIFKNSDYQLLTELTGQQVYVVSNGVVTSTPPQQQFDTQPDLFYYSYPGGSGKFFFSKNGNAHTIPFSPIGITTSPDFVIEDGDGVKYSFEQVEIVNVTSLGFTNQPVFGSINSTVQNFVYHLSKIETPGGNVVEYQYDDVTYNYKGRTEFTRYKKLGNVDGTFPSSAETRIETGHKVFGKNLRKILVNGRLIVEFMYESCNRIDLDKAQGETGNFAIDKIKIYKGEVEEIFDFEYGYFNFTSSNYCGISPNSNQYRLKLNSVQRSEEGPYTFTYFGNNYLPNRDIFETDHWGYYSTSGGKFAIDETGFFLGGHSKDPDLNTTKIGVIEKIVYPTKGLSEFYYELNQARDTLETFGVNLINKSLGIYYDPSAGVQMENFTLTTPKSVTVMYNTTTAPVQANLRFDVTLTGPNGYWRQFQSVSGNDLTSVSLQAGNYTLTVDQVGFFEEGYVNLFWVEQEFNYSTTIGNFQLGGLRVKEIRHLDKEGGSIENQSFFDYTIKDNPSVSSGKIANKPRYFYSIDKIIRGLNQTGSGLLDKEASYHVQSSSAVLPMAGLNGYHVLYTEVTQSNSSGKDIGFVFSKFSFVNDLKAYVTFPAVAPISFNWMRGLLLLEEIYAKNPTNNSYRIIQRTENEYQHLYTDRSASNFSENFAHYTPPAQLNENHALGLSIELIAPEWLYQTSPAGSGYLPAIFRVSSFKQISSWTKFTKSTTTEFDALQNPIFQKTTEYFYDNPNHAQTTRVVSSSSDGATFTDYMLYPHDYSGGSSALNDMRSNGLFALPVEQVRMVARGSQSFIVGGNLNEYKTGGKGLLDKVFVLSPGTAVPLSQFKFSNTSMGNLPGFSSGGNYSKDNKYFQKILFENYDTKGNPGKYQETSGNPVRIRWDNTFNNVYGICKGCSPDFFAFTSFEDDVKGGWTYSGSTTTSHSKAGNRGYNLSGGAVSISSIPTGSDKFKVGFWARTSGTNPSLSIGGTPTTVTSTWQWLEKEITSSSLSISGINVIIDELRLHPVSAEVETYTYTQLKKIASTTDSRGYVTIYEYDQIGRLKTVKDEDGNILEHYEYNYATGN
ncbi:hypothetical protein SAMN00777080_3555 [Aquiflexum balticum DSM 16537]|uniref:YD repeat-containing protein n=1 Tax=Aquiflexum balticum DSM 16537 TaxID=758820 RepID=A0A1W2H8E0_9BACT|nr:RHS repeat domain-containing protein [Aquiflexum balticum]SMD44918.1 hypothetical protein SAMN00777080_3555 [Aquiflexum balticum DSM 16537]